MNASLSFSGPYLAALSPPAPSLAAPQHHLPVARPREAGAGGAAACPRYRVLQPGGALLRTARWRLGCRAAVAGHEQPGRQDGAATVAALRAREHGIRRGLVGAAWAFSVVLFRLLQPSGPDGVDADARARQRDARCRNRGAHSRPARRAARHGAVHVVPAVASLSFALVCAVESLHGSETALVTGTGISTLGIVTCVQAAALHLASFRIRRGIPH